MSSNFFPSPSPDKTSASFDDELRRALLLTLGLLDTGREDVFDGLTRCAAVLCACPVAVLSVMDDQQCWFKSLHGPNAQALVRGGELCRATLQGVGWLEILDLANDSRFSGDGVEHLGLRYYASLPLRVEGVVVGALSIGDSRPRAPMSDDVREGLSGLRAAVEALLASRRPGAEIELRALERRRELLSRMSHEMRTPLHAVLGFAQLLQLNSEVAQYPQALCWAAQIERASGTLLSLVEQMLALADSQTGRRAWSRPPAVSGLAAGPQARQ